MAALRFRVCIWLFLQRCEWPH